MDDTLPKNGDGTRVSALQDDSQSADGEQGQEILERGALHFAVEARLLRELGERLVKQPEVAFVELIKNAYDADAESCTISVSSDALVVSDNGRGMTLAEFTVGWMRIGTSAKTATPTSAIYSRSITGEKGIGRFAVRFLGRKLSVLTVAEDPKRGRRTVLEASFDWAEVDRYEDLGRVAVPYTLRYAAEDEEVGTTLSISELRIEMAEVSWDHVRTASLALLSPIRALFSKTTVPAVDSKLGNGRKKGDPGFKLLITGISEDRDDLADVASQILESYVLRAVVRISGQKLQIDLYRRDPTDANLEPELSIRDKFPNEIGPLQAEIRFYPKRKGSFADLPVDGRRALGWVTRNSGVAIYDRSFRVLPYGTAGDDWLRTAQDTARRSRHPRSSVSMRHFPMAPDEASSTELNYMLRLPHPQQLIGVVLVEGARTADGKTAKGLISSADREGFVDNAAFRQVENVIRGAVEAIAYVDRKLQKEAEDAKRLALVEQARKETQEAIAEIRANPRLTAEDRARLVDQFAQAQVQLEHQEVASKQREQQLEVLSLLGVVAGFMTHEFGVAVDALQQSREALLRAGKLDSIFTENAAEVGRHIATLKEFATYSRAYIGASAKAPSKPYPARPRLQQVSRIFGPYAAERQIEIEIDVERDVLAPQVPVALYNGVALNLYTNALKAVAACAGDADRRIAFRAWNEAGVHHLLVADTGVGIPLSFRDRIFDPLVSTTSSNADPLGSGLGLGLTLVRRAVESFRGKVAVVDAPPGFSTAVEVRLPLRKE